MTIYHVAGNALIKRGNEYLVLRRSIENDYMPLKWDIPGGEAEPGETIEDTIKREVYEETKLEITIGNVVYIYTNIYQIPARQTYQVIYECQYKKGEVTLDLHEHDGFRWIRFEDISSLDTIAFLSEFIQDYQPLD